MTNPRAVLLLCALLWLGPSGCKKEGPRGEPAKQATTTAKQRARAAPPTSKPVPASKPAAAATPPAASAPASARIAGSPPLTELSSKAILALMRSWKPDPLLRSGARYLETAFVGKPEYAAILVQVVGGPEDAPGASNLSCSGATVAQKHVYERGTLHVLIAKHTGAEKGGKTRHAIVAHWRKPFARPQPAKDDNFTAGVCRGSFSIEAKGDLDGDGRPEFFVWHTLTGPFIHAESKSDEVRHLYVLQLELDNSLQERLHLQQDITSQLDARDQRTCKVLAADLSVRKKTEGLLEVRRLQRLPCHDGAGHLDCEAADQLSAKEKALCQEGCRCGKQPFVRELYRWRAAERRWVGPKAASVGNTRGQRAKRHRRHQRRRRR